MERVGRVVAERDLGLASALSVTASDPLLPVITNVLLAIVAEPAFGAAPAGATSAAVDVRPTANAAAATSPSGRARPRLSLCMGETSFC